MIKRMTMLARKDGMTVSDFRNYWYVNHAELVKKMPRLGKYIQNHIVENIVPDIGGPEFSVDGIPELWFADEDSKNAALQSTAAKALPLDEPNFMRGITILAIEETVVRPGDGDAKVMLLCRNGAGAASLNAPGSWLARLADELPRARRCVVNQVVLKDRRAGVWCEPSPPDVIVELRFADEKAARDAFQSAGFSKIAAEARAQDQSIAVFLVDEKPIV